MTCAGLSHEAKLFQAASCRTAFPASGSANGSIHGHLKAPATASGLSNGARTADGNARNRVKSIDCERLFQSRSA